MPKKKKKQYNKKFSHSKKSPCQSVNSTINNQTSTKNKIDILKNKIESVKKTTLYYIIFTLLLGTIVSTLSLFNNIVNTKDKLFGTNTQALHYYKLGEKYFNDDYFLESTEQFKKAYEINHNLLKVKFYYVYSMLRLDESKNVHKAKKILYENSDYLDDDEKVLYGLVEDFLGNYSESSKQFSDVSDLQQLRKETLFIYFTTYTKVAFKSDFYNGSQIFEQNELAIIDEIRKYDSPHIGDGAILSRFFADGSENTTPFERHTTLNGLALSLQNARIIMYNIYIEESLNNKEISRVSVLLRNASKIITDMNREDVKNDYLKLMFRFIENYSSDLNNIELSDLKIVLENTISRIDNPYIDIDKATMKDLNKCKRLFNELIKRYLLPWEEFELS